MMKLVTSVAPLYNKRSTSRRRTECPVDGCPGTGHTGSLDFALLSCHKYLSINNFTF